jgi:acyl-CoA thioester hydrolase
VHLKTYVKKVSKIKIIYGHELYNQEGVLCAKGETSVVSVRKEDFSLVRFDKTYPELYEKYQENIR